MNRFLSAVLVFALIGVLSGCTNRMPSPEHLSVSSAAPASLDSQDEKPEESELPLDETPLDETMIQVDLEFFFGECIRIFNDTKLAEKGYPNPTREEHRRMQEIVAMYDVPVVARHHDMQNYEQVLEFYSDAKAGKDAQVTIYSILDYAVYADVFIATGGKISHTMATMNFGSRNLPLVTRTIEVSKFELTESGHLLYTASAGGDTEDYHGGFCVPPHGDELRELRRTYVDPVGYSPGGVLNANWDKDHLSKLNWEFLFDTLCKTQKGGFISDLYTEPYPGDEYRRGVPATEVESLLQSYFPVPTEMLHALKRYDPEQDVYAWTGFMGGGFNPTPEVICAEQNSDGSLSLTVGALSLEFGEEYASTSLLTVMPQPYGSFQYLSNKIETEGNLWAND